MNCVKCGSVIAEGNKFCMICGTPVPAAAPAAQTAPAQAFDSLLSARYGRREYHAASEQEIQSPLS